MYGEWLVLYNTVFNYVLLAFTSEVSGLNVRKSRLFLSAFISGLFVVLFRGFFGSSFVSFFLLIALAFGLRLNELIRRGVVVWIAALFLGGCLLLLQPLLHNLSSTSFLIVGGLVASAALYLFYRSWHSEKQQRLEASFVLSTKLIINEVEVPLSGYVDTGNVCVEPLSGKPVHFVSYQAIMEYLPTEWRGGLETWNERNPFEVSMLPSNLKKRIRFIQLATVQEEQTIALGIRFEKWFLEQPNQSLTSEYIVLTKNASKFPKNTEAILHVSALLHNT